MTELGCMKRWLLPASAIFVLAPALTTCFPLYRYQSATCKQRGAALDARVEKLKRDADQKLIVGTKKDVVVRFFSENGIPVTFGRGEASGTISTSGCAPAGCGSDAALFGMRVTVDEMGTVIAAPVVTAIYADCL